jgi:hypothetical protein
MIYKLGDMGTDFSKFQGMLRFALKILRQEISKYSKHR